MQIMTELRMIGWPSGMLLLGIMMWGCGHTREIGTGFSGPEGQAARQELTGREVSVELRNGKEVDGVVSELNADTLRLSLQTSPTQLSFGFSEIHRIIARNHGSGLGIGVGILAGCALGATLAAIADQPEPGNFMAENLHTAVIIVGGYFGGGIGGLIGSPIPPNDVYQVRPAKPDTIVIQIDKILEEDATSVRVRIGSGNYVLPKSACQLSKSSGGVYATGPLALFEKLGVPLR